MFAAIVIFVIVALVKREDIPTLGVFFVKSHSLCLCLQETQLIPQEPLTQAPHSSWTAFLCDSEPELVCTMFPGNIYS